MWVPSLFNQLHLYLTNVVFPRKLFKGIIMALRVTWKSSNSNLWILNVVYLLEELK